MMSPPFKFIAVLLAMFFLIPGGGFLALYTPYRTWTATHGTPIYATVDNVESVSGSQRDPTTYDLYVHYEENGQVNNNAYVPRSSRRFNKGDHVTIYADGTSYVVKGDYHLNVIFIGLLMMFFGLFLLKFVIIEVGASRGASSRLTSNKTSVNFRKKSQLTDAAIFFGLLNIAIVPIPIAAPAAILCGVFGLRKLKKDPTAGNKSHAWIGITFGTFSLLLMLVLLLQV